MRQRGIRLQPVRQGESGQRRHKILEDLRPDPYPIEFGVVKVRADQSSQQVILLRKFPSAFSPADDTS